MKRKETPGVAHDSFDNDEDDIEDDDRHGVLNREVKVETNSTVSNRLK